MDRELANVLRFTMQSKMHLLPMMMILWVLAAVPAVELQCDTLTQYPHSGECCQMCGPGTYVLHPNCENPLCTECNENEYQEKYNNEKQCKRQEYCDPNKNFERSVHTSKKKKTICKCKPGFHCSGDACLTCLKHEPCLPGYGAVSIGNHFNDTVCKECPDGTFSNSSSLDGVCQKWTECGNGFYIKQRGTTESDNICEKTSRTHIVVIGVSVFLIVIAILGFVYWQCRGNIKDKVKNCVESCRGEELKETPRETYVTIPTQSPEIDSLIPEQETTHEEGSTLGRIMTPEENDDSPLPALTDKGNYVTQERGKSATISRQESQTQTF